MIVWPGCLFAASVVPSVGHRLTSCRAWGHLADYLRDNLTQSKEGLVLRGFNYCIIDEVDSILIDEARTPLIISGPAGVQPPPPPPLHQSLAAPCRPPIHANACAQA